MPIDFGFPVPPATPAPQPFLEERWPTIDATNWTSVGWSIVTPGQVGASVLASGNARLAAVNTFSIVPFALNPGSGLLPYAFIYNRLRLEFEIVTLLNSANIDTTNTFLGLSLGAADTRATSSGLIAWGFNTQKQFVGILKQSAGSELLVGPFSSTRGTAPDSIFQTLGLDIQQGSVDFYQNGVKVATQNLGSGNVFLAQGKYLNFYLQALPAGSTVMLLGYMRIWYSTPGLS